jgi:hypothetical protein
VGVLDVALVVAMAAVVVIGVVGLAAPIAAAVLLDDEGEDV